MSNSEYKAILIKIDGTDITDYLTDDGYEVQWYDLSYDAGRQANGLMRMNVIAQKYKILLHTKPLTLTQFTTFYTKIRANTTFSVCFLDPYSGTYKTINCYRGDRNAVMKWDRTDTGILFEPNDVNLIEL